MKQKQNAPIEPEIELDGGYAYCPICLQRYLQPNDIITKCPGCDQLIDWSWMKRFKNK